MKIPGPIFPIAVVFFAGACASAPKGYDLARYRAGLAATATSASVTPGSTEEKKAMQRFRSLFGDFTPKGMRKNAPRVYAPGAYFSDTLKTVHGNRAIAAYLAHAAGRVHEVRVVMQDSARSGRDYYFRWEMFITMNQGDSPLQSIGVSQVRFDAEGRIAFHQDFWDGAHGLYEHLPGTGCLINFYRGRL